MKPEATRSSEQTRYTDAEEDYGGIKEIALAMVGGAVWVILVMMAALALPAYSTWIYLMGGLLFFSAIALLVAAGTRLWRRPRGQ